MKYSYFAELLKESPYLYNTKLDLADLSHISFASIEEGYNKLGSITEQDIDVYENKENGAIVVGRHIDTEFYIALRIICEERSLYVKSMRLRSNRKHIKMLNTGKEFARQAIAIDVYTFVAKRFDLVSDRIQYLGAKILWQSLAKRAIVNVYVFDEATKSYLKNSDGSIVKYNGRNIDEDEIWGREEKHQDRLLVATTQDFD